MSSCARHGGRMRHKSRNHRIELGYRRIYGWEAGIRTPIHRSRVCSPTVGRPPTKTHFNIGRARFSLPVAHALLAHSTRLTDVAVGSPTCPTKSTLYFRATPSAP